MAPATPDVTGASAPLARDLPARPASGEDAEAWLEATRAKLAAHGVGAVEMATLLEIVALDVDWRVSALAATALELARQLDNPRTSATAKSMCAGRLQEALDRLLELNPPKTEDTPLDRIRTELRLAEAAG